MRSGFESPECLATFVHPINLEDIQVINDLRQALSEALLLKDCVVVRERWHSSPQTPRRSWMQAFYSKASPKITTVQEEERYVCDNADHRQQVS